MRARSFTLLLVALICLLVLLFVLRSRIGTDRGTGLLVHSK